MSANNEVYIKEDETKGESGTNTEEKKDMQIPGMDVQTSWKV
jgi:hypothetical protein